MSGRRDAGWYGALLVAVGGLVISPLPESSWAADLPFRGSMAGRMTGLAVTVAGLAMLTFAWIGLWQAARRRTTSLEEVRWRATTWCLPLLTAPPLFSRDGWSYAAQGELVHIGLTPYVWTPSILEGPISEAVDPRWAWTPAPYGPLPLALGGWAAHVVADPWLLVVAHRLIALLGLALLGWALPRLCVMTGRDPVLVSAIVLPSPLVVAHGVGGVHNDLLTVGLAACALVLAQRHGLLAGAAVGGLAAAVKAPGGLVCIGVALLCTAPGAALGRRMRSLVVAAGVSVTTVWVIGVLAGTGNGWVSALDVPSSINTPLSVTAVVSGLVPHSKTAGVVAMLGVLTVLALRRPTGEPSSAVHTAALALTTAVALGPVVHAWYLLWCVPVAACCHLGPRRQAMLLWACAALGLSAPLDSSLEGRPVELTLTVALVVGAAGAAALAVRAGTAAPAHEDQPALPA